MPQGGDPEDWGQFVAYCRQRRHWNQLQLSQASGVNNRMLSLYQQGDERPSEGTAGKIARSAGVPLWQVEELVALFGAARRAADAGGPDEAEALGPGAELAQGVADAALLAASPHLLELQALAGEEEPAPGEEELRRIEELWRLLAATWGQGDRRRRQRRIESLCVTLCAESERAAAADAGCALELAELALALAGLAPEEKARHDRLEPYVWGHVGNARRVLCDLAAADRAFAEEASRFKEQGPAEEPDLLDRARLLDLEASLRRAQRRFGEAIELHEQALEATRPERRGYILLNKANVQEDLGDYEGAISSLQKAASLVDGEREPRLLFGIRFNWAVNLAHLGRPAEAEGLLPGLRALTARLGNTLDEIRLAWLAGRLDAALGRVEPAIAALERVRAAFTSRGMGYDAALAGLELAVLHLKEGRTAEVKALALEMTPIFQALQIGRETLASLDLFCRAAAQEQATAELAQRLLDELRRPEGRAPEEETR